MMPNDGRVISNFIVQALRNEPITIYGDGKQTRSFCFVEDLIEALIKTMECEYSNPLNLGNPFEISKSLNASVPCLNPIKKPVLALPKPLLSFL